jgi:hypothetical protein
LVAGILILLMVLIWSTLGYFDRWRNAPVLIGTAYWLFVLAVYSYRSRACGFRPTARVIPGPGAIIRQSVPAA